MLILQYKKRALGCSLSYRQNIDKPQSSSVSGTIFSSQVPILGVAIGLLILPKGGAVIEKMTNQEQSKPQNWGAANLTVGTQTKRVSASPPPDSSSCTR